MTGCTSTEPRTTYQRNTKKHIDKAYRRSIIARMKGNDTKIIIEQNTMTGCISTDQKQTK